MYSIGQIGESLESIFVSRTTARSVKVSASVLRHIEKHRGEFDVDRAMEMLPEVLNNPKIVYQGKKTNSLQFVEDFNERYFLLAPIKYLPDELWLETIIIEEKSRFLRRWAKREIFYTRK